MRAGYNGVLYAFLSEGLLFNAFHPDVSSLALPRRPSSATSTTQRGILRSICLRMLLEHTHMYIYIYIYTYSYIICIYAHIYIYAGAFVRALIISYDFFTWHGSRWAMHEFTLAPRTPPSMTHARTARTSQVNPIDILAAETSSVDLSSAASSFRLQSLGL